MGIEVILFDADGTLFDFQRAERQALRDAMAGFDLACDDDVHPAAYARINRGLWQQLEQGHISREHLRRLAEGTFLIDGAEALVRDCPSV